MKSYAFTPTIFEVGTDWYDLNPIGDNQYVDADSLKLALDALAARLSRQYPVDEVKRIFRGVVHTTSARCVGGHRYIYTFSLRVDD